MDPLDRTARWVQQHSQHIYHRPGADSYSRSQLRPPRPDGPSSHQSSGTDLGGHDHRGVGSGGRAYARQTAAYAAVDHTSKYHQLHLSNESIPSLRTQNRSRSHSHSYSHSHSRSQTYNNNPQPTEFRPRLNIPTKIYSDPNLPAFVQGPPGSGYPMSMSSTRQPPTQVRAAVPVQPMSPVQVPVPLNPKKSRPTVHKRRPSLSGETFEPPDYPSHHHELYRDTRAPRPQGRGGGFRMRAASESRR